MEVLSKTGVMQQGHFRLTSGRHADTYFQCARLFENAESSALLCRVLAEKLKDITAIDMVAGPALGAMIMAYEMGRQLGVPNIFTERDNGVMTLRRGFVVPQGAKVLVVEDAVTTGGSVQECIDVIRAQGGIVVAVGAIVDRSNGKVDFGIPFMAATRLDVVSWTEDECPLCKQSLPVVKPGSRKV